MQKMSFMLEAKHISHMTFRYSASSAMPFAIFAITGFMYHHFITPAVHSNCTVSHR